MTSWTSFKAAKKFFSPEKDVYVVALISFVFFWVAAWAWPFGPGRDALGYIAYYFDFNSAHPYDPFFMMLRTPLPSFFFVPALIQFGTAFVEWIMCAIYVAAMVACFKVGMLWSRKLAYIFWIGVLFQFGYSSMYHVLSSDPLSTLLSTFFFAIIFLNADRWAMGSFFLAGVLAGLNFLSRPSNQLFIVFAILPFLVTKLSLRRRAALAFVFIAGMAPSLLGWAYINKQKRGTFTISRATHLLNPIWRVWIVDQTISPDNGPKSRLLAEKLERSVLLKPEHKGVTAKQYMAASNYHEKINELAEMIDREWGPSNNYKVLRDVAVEAIQRNPGKYFLGVLSNYIQTLTLNYKHPVPLVGGASVFTNKKRVAYIGGDGKDHFDPIDQVDLSATKNSDVYEQMLKSRHPSIHRAYLIQNIQLPARSGSVFLGRILNLVAQVYPPALLCVLLFFTSFLFKLYLTNLERILLFSVLFSLGHLLAGSLTIHVAIYQYRQYFEPIFILSGILGLKGIIEGRKQLKLRMSKTV